MVFFSSHKAKYEKIPDAILNLPKHIRTQFKERFVSWALGVHIGQTGVKIAPTFPTLKKYATETVDLPVEDTKRDDFYTFCKSTQIGATEIAANPNLNGLDQNATPYASNYNVSQCTMYDISSNAFTKAFNAGMCSMNNEAHVYQASAVDDPNPVGNPTFGGYDARALAVTYVTREVPDGYNDSDNKRLLNLRPDKATYTLPLFINGSVNFTNAFIKKNSESSFWKIFIATLPIKVHIITPRI